MQRRRRCQEQEHAQPHNAIFGYAMFCHVLFCFVMCGKGPGPGPRRTRGDRWDYYFLAAGKGVTAGTTTFGEPGYAWAQPPPPRKPNLRPAQWLPETRVTPVDSGGSGRLRSTPYASVQLHVAPYDSIRLLPILPSPDNSGRGGPSRPRRAIQAEAGPSEAGAAVQAEAGPSGPRRGRPGRGGAVQAEAGPSGPRRGHPGRGGAVQAEAGPSRPRRAVQGHVLLEDRPGGCGRTGATDRPGGCGRTGATDRPGGCGRT
eukprot:gene25171-biopygen16481